MTVKSYRLGEVASYLGAELRGDADFQIDGIAPLPIASLGKISFLERGKLRKHLATTQASAVILSAADADRFSGNVLIVSDPYVAYAKVSEMFVQVPTFPAGVHPQAVVGENCSIAKDAAIAANCSIGNNVVIGSGTVLEPGCVIGDNVHIGEHSHLYANVTIYYGVIIGNKVIIHSGAVLGADGFGMANDRGVWHKIHQLGSVRVGNDVEIGANTCIDRGALEDTIIEDGVKLDNLIQVGHNVQIGAHTAVAGCVAIAGSTKIGKYCMIAGAVSLNGHIEIADRTVVTGASSVGRSITEPGGVYSSGIPAQPHFTWMRVIAQLTRLGKMANKSRYSEENMHE